MRVLIKIEGSNEERSYASKVAQGGGLELSIQRVILQAMHPYTQYVLLSGEDSRDWIDEEARGK